MNLVYPVLLECILTVQLSRTLKLMYLTGAREEVCTELSDHYNEVLLYNNTAMLLIIIPLLLHSSKGAQYSDEHVCMSVCPHRYLQNHVTDLQQIFVHSPMPMAQSCGGTAIHYILLVLWMTSLFSRNGPCSVFQYRGRVWCLRLPCLSKASLSLVVEQLWKCMKLLSQQDTFLTERSF